jgi:hypothetical protein
VIEITGVDMTTLGDVRFRGQSGHSEVRRQCPLMIQPEVRKNRIPSRIRHLANAIKRLLRPSLAGYSFVVVRAVLPAIGVVLMLLVPRSLLAPHRDEGPIDVAAQPAP